MFPATSLPLMEFGRGGQSRTVATSSQDSDADVTPHPEIVFGSLFLVLVVCADVEEEENKGQSTKNKALTLNPSHKPLA